MEYYYNFATIIESIPSRIETLCNELYPEGKKKSENWVVGSSDGERGQSFQISLKPNSAGCYFDRADHGIKGNVIALVALRKNLTYQEAGKWLGEFCNIQPEQKFENKKRPKPQIDRRKVKNLNQDSIDYAKKRGIDEEMLRRLKIVSFEKNIAIPHFDAKGELVMVKYWPTDGSKKIWTNKDPVHTLFGKELIDPVASGGEVIICEGHWDAMTWIKLGYQCVSIPSGAENDNWIEEDWIFLSQFSMIYLNFDNDDPGQEAEARVKVRLGNDRCRTIKYEAKDANEVFQKGLDESILHDAFKAAKEAPVEHIVDPTTIKSVVRETLTSTGSGADVPFFLSDMKNLQFRPHEATLWFGFTGHGKSTAIMNQFAYQASLGVMGMIASFEDNPTVNYASMMLQYSSDSRIGESPEYDKIYDELTSHILFFDSVRRTRPDVMIATMIRAHKQLGICHFAVDNVMTMDVDRQDNTKQAEVADKFRVFVASYPVHLHIAAHPRKPVDTSMMKPPEIADVRGASEWGDMSQNAISTYRDITKAGKVAEMRDQGIDEFTISNYATSCADGKFIVKKQRTTGELPIVSFRFESKTKRFFNSPEELNPYSLKEEEPEEPEYPF